MRVFHFTSGNITGGAARGAYFLHRSLKLQGIDSRFFIADEDASTKFPDVEVLSLGINDIMTRNRYRFFEEYIFNSNPDKNNDLFSVGSGIFDEKMIRLSYEADLFHFHWINDSFCNLEILNKINIPIVWTFRDMWPFTGGCHYSKGCERFKYGCGNCPALGSHIEDDLSKKVYRRKEKIDLKKTFPVAISGWLQESASSSQLYRDKKITLIPNCIDTNIFIPFDKFEMRKKFNLPYNKNIILFGAINSFKDKRKGLSELLDALKFIKNKDKYHLATFGDADSDVIREIGFSYSNFGVVNDDYLLAQIYSAASVFVAPSLEEAFGKTIVEAMACGTPVVAFGATGPKELILHKENGYLARPFDVKDLSAGIQFILEHENISFLNERARKTVVNNYSLSVVSSQYISLYNSILEEKVGPKNIFYENNNKFNEMFMSGFEEYLKFEWIQEGKVFLFDNRLENHLLGKVNCKIAIYGAGSFGRNVGKILRHKGIQIECFIDSNNALHNTFVDSLPVYSIEKCKDYFILIASTWFKDIEKKLKEYGLRKIDNYLICKEV